MLFTREGVQGSTHTFDHALDVVAGILQATAEKDVLQEMRRTPHGLILVTSADADPDTDRHAFPVMEFVGDNAEIVAESGFLVHTVHAAGTAFYPKRIFSLGAKLVSIVQKYASPLAIR